MEAVREGISIFFGVCFFFLKKKSFSVGPLRNVFSCRRKDDIPTQLPADEGLAHESQSSTS